MNYIYYLRFVHECVDTQMPLMLVRSNHSHQQRGEMSQIGKIDHFPSSIPDDSFSLTSLGAGLIDV